MSERQQIVHTLCLHTSDAINRRDGKFTFKLPGGAPRLQAIKVGLGSLEFPMTQWTIESQWNRVYFNEGIRILPEFRSLQFQVQSLSMKDSKPVTIMLPLRVNPIIQWDVKEDLGIVVATFQYPHGLWSSDGSVALHTHMWWGDACCIGCPFGTLYIKQEKALRFTQTQIAFSIDEARRASLVKNANDRAPFAGYLYVPDFPNLHEVAVALTHAAHGCHGDVIFDFGYDARTNRVVPSFRVINGSFGVHMIHNPFSTQLGVGAFDRREDVTPQKSVTMETESSSLWHSVSLSPGWYGPSHRPMNTSAPSRFTTEVQFALNRLVFGIPERVAEGSMTSYYLVFVDPAGQTLFCPIPTGRYTPDTLCELLEQNMSLLALSATPGIAFSVSYEQNRFIFSCEVRDEAQRVQSVDFSLAFNHPAQFNPERIGFAPLMYAGSHTYTSTTECVVPDVNPYMGGLSPPMNMYRVDEITHQQRFRIHAAPAYLLTGVITKYEPAQAAIVVKTFVGQLPHSHGLIEGDVVQITQSSKQEIFVSSEDGGWTERTVTPCPIESSWNRYAVVLETDKTLKDLYPTTLLRLRVRPSEQLATCMDQTIGLHITSRPFNLCTDANMERSVPARILGAKSGAMQWGVDGACFTSDRVHRVAPLEMPYVHNLDHPDYVLMYLNEGKQGTLLKHTYGSSTTTPLCKIVLYPLFREERMLPRDTTTISGESLSNFTVSFTNADGRPYNFHGAEFSFSLNLIQIQD